MSKGRNSRLEIIKIIAILMVIISHSMPIIGTGAKGYINIAAATASKQGLLLIIFRYLGQTADAIFAVSSFWFLTKETNLNKTRIIRLHADIWSVSILLLVAFLLSPYTVPNSMILKHIFPVLSDNNWFLTCYLIIYIIHISLNTIIEKLSTRALFGVAFVLYLIYGLLPYYDGDILYYNRLFGFIAVYFICAFIRRVKTSMSNAKTAYLWLLLASVGQIILIVGTNYIGTHGNVFFSMNVTLWNTFTNPFNLIIAFSLLFIALSKEWECSFCNYLSSLVMLVYIIHQNLLVRRILRPDYFEYIYNNYGYQRIIVWVGVCFAFNVVICFIIAVLYDLTIRKVIQKLALKIWSVIGTAFSIVVGKFLRERQE